MSVTSYNYDDGTFKGILRCTETNNWVQTHDHYDTVNQVPVFNLPLMQLIRVQLHSTKIKYINVLD